MTEKIPIGAKTFLYPMPTVLVGADVEGEPNYLTVAYCGIIHAVPPMISIALGKPHYTNIGIKQNMSFSVNIPSAEMVEVTDYCGIVSGRRIDKNGLFTSFYGRTKTAPMIEECPLNLECTVRQILDFDGTNEIFIGEIVEAYSRDEYLTNNLPDIEKINPICFSMHDNRYFSLGSYIGKAWQIGRDYKKP
ncbi:flavin reductase family protein [Methanocalculus sp.]|uniref:flavin reductase family protein n=1 Tax=Methanocalculus sp. TaxID=2004547 RepID=UPI0027223B50|nr:flavin reductase family protein [Methanocalculus sp.]MDO8841379.1 flavin reductase family protein [Methanocalculus sp.]